MLANLSNDKNINSNLSLSFKKVVFFVIVSLSVVGLACSLSACGSNNVNNNAITTGIKNTNNALKKYNVEFLISEDEDFNSDSSPVIMRLIGEDENNKDVDFYHAVVKDDKHDIISMKPGHYKIEVSDCMLSNGNVLATDSDRFDGGVIIHESNDNSIKVFFGDNIDARGADIPRVNRYADFVKTALKNGDESLSGENGKAIVETVARNLKAFADIRHIEAPSEDFSVKNY